MIEHLFYYHKKILNKLSLNSTNIHCKSLIETYKTWNESLSNISLAKFDTKSSKKCTCNKIIHWVSFNLHKDLEKYYRKILLLFMPFHTLEYNFKSQHLSWKNVHLNQKDDLEKIRKQFAYNFNILNDYGEEWDNLQSQLQEYTKKHEVNEWEFFFINEINLDASKPKLNMFTNTKEVEVYNLTYEYPLTLFF